MKTFINIIAVLIDRVNALEKELTRYKEAVPHKQIRFEGDIGECDECLFYKPMYSRNYSRRYASMHFYICDDCLKIRYERELEGDKEASRVHKEYQDEERTEVPVERYWACRYDCVPTPLGAGI